MQNYLLLRAKSTIRKSVDTRHMSDEHYHYIACIAKIIAEDNTYHDRKELYRTIVEARLSASNEKPLHGMLIGLEKYFRELCKPQFDHIPYVLAQGQEKQPTYSVP